MRGLSCTVMICFPSVAVTSSNTAVGTVCASKEMCEVVIDSATRLYVLKVTDEHLL